MHKHSVTWLSLFVIVAVMFLQLPPLVARQDSVLNTYRALVEVDALARQNYIDAIEDDRLVHGAIRGMMFQLDPYSGYLAPEELSAFERRSAGDYSGIGVEIGMLGGRPTIIAPFEASPAARAGLRAGDTIVSIDGEDVEGRSIFDIEERLVGPPGTTVHVRVLHPGQGDPVDAAVLRGRVSIHTVHGYRRDAARAWDYFIDRPGRIGYLRLSDFRDNTMRDVDAALESMFAEGLRGLIIDLRFNPGGLMEQAGAMVDRFVDEGLILSTVTRRGAVQEYAATGPGTVSDVALAVLINGGSGSSSEIVAGALQDHGRAIVVGERSFGKGSVQHLIRLRSYEAAIKLTVAYYRLPGGRIIHRTPANERTDEWGVIPDVRVELSDQEEHALLESWRTSDLPAQQATAPDQAEPQQDRQLAAALANLIERMARR